MQKNLNCPCISLPIALKLMRGTVVMIEHKPSSFLWLLLFLFAFPLLCCGVLSYNLSLSTSGPTVPVLPARFVQVPLFTYLNNKGIGSAPGQGNLDGSGFAYPTNQLPPAGQRILNEVPYQFPDSAPRANDNVVALGQTIKLPQGNYQQAFLLVTTSWGSVSNMIIIVHYTDGSTSSGSLSVADWRIGSVGVVNTSYRYSSTGIDQGPVRIYAIQIAMDRTKIASSLTLPMTTRPGPFRTSLHVFALTLQYAA
jgi:alpha-L-fucosidase